jgi:hypothetical protein
VAGRIVARGVRVEVGLVGGDHLTAGGSGSQFVDQIALGVGERSRRADLWMERIARRIAHRKEVPPAGGAALTDPGPL